MCARGTLGTRGGPAHQTWLRWLAVVNPCRTAVPVGDKWVESRGMYVLQHSAVVEGPENRADKTEVFARHLVLQGEGIRGGEDHRRHVVLGLLALQLHQTHRIRLIQDLLDYRGTLLEKTRKNEGEVNEAGENEPSSCCHTAVADKHALQKLLPKTSAVGSTELID